jgi:hypothetical protein
MSQNTRILEVLPTGEGKCLVTLFRFMDDKILDMEMPLGASTFRGCLTKWQRGAMIQNAFADLNADQREFLMTGITPEEWASMFGEE